MSKPAQAMNLTAVQAQAAKAGNVCAKCLSPQHHVLSAAGLVRAKQASRCNSLNAATVVRRTIPAWMGKYNTKTGYHGQCFSANQEEISMLTAKLPGCKASIPSGCCLCLMEHSLKHGRLPQFLESCDSKSGNPEGCTSWKRKGKHWRSCLRNLPATPDGH